MFPISSPASIVSSDPYLSSVSIVSSDPYLSLYRYDAFGRPEFRSGPQPGNPRGTIVNNNTTGINNRFLFTGREWVQNYGFYEYRARAYNPALGRFMSEDPLGIQTRGVKLSAAAFPNIAPGQLPKEFANSGANLFDYCGNDPMDGSDPMGLEFVDQGYGFTNEPSPANFGYTAGVISARTGVTQVDGGYTARLIDVDLTVRSTIRTQSKQSYDPNWNHKGPDLFARNKPDIERTIKHEGDHRENNSKWYEKNHDSLIKEVNSGKKIYKTPEAAAQGMQKKVDSVYNKFSQPDISHTSKAWKDWNPPALEHPRIP